MDSAPRFTFADAYRTVTSALMIVLGIVIWIRTFPFGLHLLALLVGACFIGLGVHRLSFVVRYVRRGRGTA